MIYLATTTELRNKPRMWYWPSEAASVKRTGGGKPPYWAPPSGQKLIQVDLDRLGFRFQQTG